jgi:hypothetical protein
MIVPSEIKDGLSVAREDLAEALGIVYSMMGRRASGVSLRFDDGWLYIATGKTAAKARANGVWPLTIIVASSWVRRLARSLPPGDPVSLHVEDGRLYANKYSVPCQWTMEEDPLSPSLVEMEDVRDLIARAGTILKPFRVRKEDLRLAVEMAGARGPASWQRKEKKMIVAVAKAWAVLAQLGVETSDLRSLVDNAVRTAWMAEGQDEKKAD